MCIRGHPWPILRHGEGSEEEDEGETKAGSLRRGRREDLELAAPLRSASQQLLRLPRAGGDNQDGADGSAQAYHTGPKYEVHREPTNPKMIRSHMQTLTRNQIQNH